MSSDRSPWRTALCTAFVCAPAAAQAGVHVPVHREVLVLTSTAAADSGADSIGQVHDVLQTPLNFLGMVVRQHDLSEGPPRLDPARTRAVITWFQGAEERPSWLWPWLHEAAAARPDLRFVHLGELGPLETPRDGQLERWFDRFGLAVDDGFQGDPLRFDVDLVAGERCAFESRPVYQRVHRGPRTVDARNQVWLRTSPTDELGPPRTPVVTGPWGGLALQPWLLRLGLGQGDRRWYVDPFAFLRDALGLVGVPAPDPCVLNGRRRFLLHVDGDGFESISTVKPGAPCARVLLEDVIDRYRLPVTVSVIIAGLTDDLQVAAPTPHMELAREIFARPYVEPASHAVLHPLHWRRPLGPHTAPRTVVWYPRLDNYEYSPVNEVRESIRFINERLLPAGRRCALMLWTGRANPAEDAILAAAELDCFNLNGGVYRYDPLHQSLGYVSPWGKQVGTAFQVYCGAANENDFEGFFSTMPGAFRHIDQTIERTGAERILKPANLYIHFYSAERPARLTALRHLIERWALRQPTAPVFASSYARAVVAAQTRCRIVRTPGGFAFHDFAGCPTVRIDGESQQIDWTRSRGLFGAHVRQGALFVHLGGDEAELVWAEDGAAAHPHVEQANHELQGVALHRDAIELVSESLARRELVLAGFPPNAELLLDVDGDVRAVPADAQGRLELTLPEPGRSRLVVRTR